VRGPTRRSRRSSFVGAGKLFCGGADVKAFGTPASRAEPSSRTIIKEIEASAKPVVAAIHGSALGLGLEFALGCHYRIAQRGAKLGLPEVKLGLLPGGGGTQRLPRVAGVEAAAKVIVEGDPVDADEAFKMGIVDEVVAGDLLPAAVEFAQRMTLRTHHPVASRRTARPPDDPAFFETERKRIASAKRGQPAPLEAPRVRRRRDDDAVRRGPEVRTRALRRAAERNGVEGDAPPLPRGTSSGEGDWHRRRKWCRQRSPASRSSGPARWAAGSR
jgi:enoyl-CoA hydratase/carnithine racemase